ncbi:TonB-dependent hemoglobin/transferrin/lactoferrin family receptor [Providencia sp. 2024EL-00732]|uniref:TonB-dependent hemoglobin/transferrin/lactoferrin family receptor n=1 Tax=Providencia sp. 2024EL-00732 TaxID=3374242 RepID=UPI0024AAF620|nr:TonB-dependent hemoglobin/transferrin/lactoferrin family receptor [Providencia rettgeri]ELR5255868.1 TonB-dependent hemoglobin/transferrin/lactoferrin family receptor [Providencia rettgeri]
MQFKPMPASIFQEKKFPISTLTIAITLAGLSHSVLAQDVIQVSASPFGFEEIAVAEQVDVIDAQAPEQQSATSALDLLKGQPGVFVSGSNSTYGQGIQMRGYDSRGVKVTIDNITQDFNSGLYDATFIDPTLINKVYIHKGSASVHHGGGALAGVVAFKTLNAADILKPGQKLGGRAFSGINRNDHSYYAGATLLGRSESFDTLLSYSQRKKHIMGSPEFELAHNVEKIHNWMLKTTWLPHPSYNLTLQLKEYRNDSLSLKQPAKPTEKTKYPNAPHERQSHQRDIAINQYFKPQNSLNWQAEWSVYYTDLYLDQTDTIKIIKKPDEYGPEERNQYTYGTKFSNSVSLPMYNWVNHYIQSGFEYYQQKQTSNQYAISYPPSELSNMSGWLVNDMTLHHLPITFSAGTRFTQYQTSRENFPENKHTNWSSRFAVSATPTSWLNLHSSYAEAYRTPRMSELYNNSNHFTIPLFFGASIKSDFRPSPDLQPETNKTWETGLKLSFDELYFKNDSLQFGSTYFHTKAKNYITVDGEYPLSFNPRARDGNKVGRMEYFPKKIFFINIPSATIHGFDSFVHYKTHWFDIAVNHNHTMGREDGTNYSLSSIRPQTLTARINAPVATTGIQIGWIGEFSAKTKFQGNAKYQRPHHKSDKGLDRYHKEVIQYAGYGVHDFYVNYQADEFIKGLSSTLTMKNAFDKQYISSMGVPQEGRNFYFNVNYNW